MNPTLRIFLEMVGFVVASIAIVYLYNRQTPAKAPINAWTPAKQSPQLALIPKEQVTIPKIEVYAQSAKKKLKLPVRIQMDLNTSVLASTLVPSDDHPVTFTTLIDRTTGKSETLQRREPYPWFAPEDKKEIRVTRGWRDTQTMTRLSGSWDLLQTKGLHWGAMGSIDLDGQKMVGASVAFRF